jgi:hypothetical protein
VNWLGGMDGSDGLIRGFGKELDNWDRSSIVDIKWIMLPSIVMNSFKFIVVDKIIIM